MMDDFVFENKWQSFRTKKRPEFGTKNSVSRVQAEKVPGSGQGGGHIRQRHNEDC